MKDLLIRKRSRIHGFGTFALKSIKKDEIIHEVSSELIFDSDLGKCAFIGNEKYLCDDGTMCYINHSCEPNVTISTEGNPKIIALRKIMAGEELVHNYEEIKSEGSHFRCNCKTKKCRKLVVDK